MFNVQVAHCINHQNGRLVTWLQTKNYPVQTGVSEMKILPLHTPLFPDNREVDSLTDLPSASVTRFGSVSAALMNVNSPIIPN